jgi:hypothetical protein
MLMMISLVVNPALQKGLEFGGHLSISNVPTHGQSHVEADRSMDSFNPTKIVGGVFTWLHCTTIIHWLALAMATPTESHSPPNRPKQSYKCV